MAESRSALRFPDVFLLEVLRVRVERVAFAFLLRARIGSFCAGTPSRAAMRLAIQSSTSDSIQPDARAESLMRFGNSPRSSSSYSRVLDMPTFAKSWGKRRIL